MPALLYDTLTLLDDGLISSSGRVDSFRRLGLDDHETLRLHARKLVLAGQPERSFELAVDHVVVEGPDAALVLAGHTEARVVVVAQRIDGQLRVRTSGAIVAPAGGGALGRTVQIVYGAASHEPTVEVDGTDIAVLIERVPDPYALWTQWNRRTRHAVSNVGAVGADLL